RALHLLVVHAAGRRGARAVRLLRRPGGRAIPTAVGPDGGQFLTKVAKIAKIANVFGITPPAPLAREQVSGAARPSLAIASDRLPSDRRRRTCMPGKEPGRLHQVRPPGTTAGTRRPPLRRRLETTPRSVTWPPPVQDRSGYR